MIPHFNAEQAALSFERAHRALRPGGIFAFSVKRGDGEAWSKDKLGAPRYFYYWQAAPLRATLRAAGFRSVAISTATIGGQGWLMVVASA